MNAVNNHPGLKTFPLRIVLAAIGLLSFAGTGCATKTTRATAIRNAAIGGAIGVLIGQTKDNHKNAYSSMYGSTGAAIGALGTLVFDESESDAEKLKKERDDLQSKLDAIQKPTLIDQGNSLFKAQLPKDVSKLIQPGEWKRYKVDYWVQDPSNSNVWLRQTEMFEVIPPTSGNQ